MPSSIPKIRLRIFQLLSVIVITILTLYIFKDKDGFQYIFGDLSYVWAELFSSTLHYLILIIVCFIMILNWATEARKWQIATKQLQELSFADSFKSILAGLAIGFFVPNRVGEFAGKSLMLKKTNFWKASFLAFYTGFAQLFTTIFWGSIAILTFSDLLIGIIPFNLQYLSISLLIIIVLSILFVYFYLNRFTSFLKRFKKVHLQIGVIEQLKISDKLYILLLSFLRFFIFSAQYIILLYLLGVVFPFIDTFFIISLLYFVLMIFPTIALTELPARSTFLVMLFTAWSDLSEIPLPNAFEARIILASTLIWIINIVIPSITGAFFIPQFSIFKRKEE